MTKFKFERENPKNILERAVNTGAQKIKELIKEENFRITPFIETEISGLISDLEDKHKIKVSEKNLLKRALEMLREEEGIFPKDLRKEYVNLVAEEIANEAAAGGQAFYQALGKKMVELKRQGIEIDPEEVEKKVKELMD